MIKCKEYAQGVHVTIQSYVLHHYEAFVRYYRDFSWCASAVLFNIVQKYTLRSSELTDRSERLA